MGGGADLHAFETEITFDSDVSSATIEYELDIVPFLVGFYAIDEIDIPTSGYYAVRGYWQDSSYQTIGCTNPPRANASCLRTSDDRYSYIPSVNISINTTNKTITVPLSESNKYQAGKRYRFIIM